MSGEKVTQKPYGLILPKRTTKVTLDELVQRQRRNAATSVFRDDEEGSEKGASGSDDESAAVELSDWRMKTLLSAPKQKSRIKKQTQLTLAKALEDDPTAFLYDEVYDEIHARKPDKKEDEMKDEKKSDGERAVEKAKPRYIQALLKTAEHRLREKERRTERKLQKEREAEGDLYADKEAFVTASFRKKMEEMEMAEEQERHQRILEERNDVRKQEDLGSFYRHLYKQQYNEEEGQIKDEMHETAPTGTVKDIDDENKMKSKPTGRRYRKRNAEVDDDDDDEHPEELCPPIRKQREVTRDTGRMRTLQEDEENKVTWKESGALRDGEEDKAGDQKIRTAIKEEAVELHEDLDADSDIDSSEHENEETKVSASIMRPWWQKRTVGTVFEAARARFLQRQARA